MSDAELAERLFERELERRDGVWIASEAPGGSDDERRTSAAFSEKWLALGFRPGFLHSEDACHTGRFGPMPPHPANGPEVSVAG